MGSHWFVYKKNKQKGPYTWQQLWREAQAGRISPRDLVWNKSMKDWVQAAKVPGLMTKRPFRVNFIKATIAVSALFFLVLSGTALYYLFIYTGSQQAAVEDENESEITDEVAGDSELGTDPEEEDNDETELVPANNQTEEPAPGNQGQATTPATVPNESTTAEPEPQEPSEPTIPFQGGTYNGPLSGGQPHGSGSWSHPDGRQYDGTFREGRIEGFGTMLFPGGERYTGEFRDGLAHGEGVMTHPDGRRISGTWVDGVFQAEDDEPDDTENDNDDENSDDDNSVNIFD